MKIKDLILELQKQNPESEIEFVGLVEYGFGETMSFETEECLIRKDTGLVRLIISGESLD